MANKKTQEEIIRKIRYLRRKGSSLPEISATLGVPKTTVFRYTKDVEILPQFRDILRSKRGGSKKRKQIKELQALEEAKQFMHLSDREKLLLISALYWGEGTKKDFGLSNTDPNLIKIFVSGLRQVLGVTDDRLGISVRIYEDLDKDKCLTFWSAIVGIPKDRFVGVNILIGKKKGKLPYGMCRVRVKKGGDLLKKLAGINKIVSESLPL